MLNIIEECFSVLKNAIKKQMAGRLYQQRLRIALLPFGQKTLHRLRLLEDAFDHPIQEVTPQKVISFWNHMLSFIPKCLHFEDV